VAGNSLRAGMNLGAELRQKLEEIHSNDGVIAEEIGATQCIVIAKVVIDFSESVF
jgi:hypothetical protein